MGLFDRVRRKRVADANQEPENREGALQIADLAPQGGSWNGLLFDNPNIGLPPALTWTFEFQFSEVSRDYGRSPVSLTIDWVPLPDALWSAMAGRVASCTVFGEPIEGSAYFFEHHRYDSVELRILEQAGSRIRVAVEVSGDVDRLGITTWMIDQWLDFDGIYVQFSDADTAEQAAAELANHTDTSALVASESGQNFKFVESRG